MCALRLTPICQSAALQPCTAAKLAKLPTINLHLLQHCGSLFDFTRYYDGWGNEIVQHVQAPSHAQSEYGYSQSGHPGLEENDESDNGNSDSDSET